MEKVKQWLKLGVPFIELAVTALRNIDENDTGTDDKVADFLEFVVRGLRAILDDDESALENVEAEFANKTIGLPISEVTK